MMIGTRSTTSSATIVIKKYGKIAANVGDEGGFATPIKKVREAMECLVQAVDRSGYAKKIVYGLRLRGHASGTMPRPRSTLSKA